MLMQPKIIKFSFIHQWIITKNAWKKEMLLQLCMLHFKVLQQIIFHIECSPMFEGPKAQYNKVSYVIKNLIFNGSFWELSGTLQIWLWRYFLIIKQTLWQNFAKTLYERQIRLHLPNTNRCMSYLVKIQMSHSMSIVVTNKDLIIFHTKHLFSLFDS